MKFKRSVFLVIMVFSVSLFAQGNIEAYKRAEKFLPQNIGKFTSGMYVYPNWIKKTSDFWYINNLKNGEKEFFKVIPDKNRKEYLFDHEKMAEAVSKITEKDCSAKNLPIDRIEFTDDKNILKLSIAGELWECNIKNYSLKKVKREEKPGGLSPDGKWTAVVKDYNLYVRSVETGEEIQLTSDGEEKYGYAHRPEWYSLVDIEKGEERKEEMPAEVKWSPDSKKIASFKLDRRNAKNLYLMQYAPKEGFRAKVWAYERALPGDTLLSMIEFFIFDVEKKKKIPVNIEPYPAFLDDGIPEWMEDGTKLHFNRWHRGYNAVDFVEVNAETGKIRTIIGERSDTYVDLYMLNPRVLKNGKEMLWTSERDGWNHIYMINMNTGEVKKQITKGEYIVRSIEYVNEKKEQVFFTAGGLEKGRDPYLRHLYRINFDGTGLTLLTPEDADHDVRFSQDGKYFTDTFSRIDLPPRSLLKRSKDGKLVKALEEGDISELLKTGWQYPEPFRVKGRDGRTDIYGAIFRPSNFDPSNKYPVIDGTYSGPQTIRTPKTFNRGYRNQDLPICELGFIVVTVDGLGSAYRSREFHHYSHKNLGDIGAEDHITAIKQLVEKYPYMDISRIGIYGHSAGGYDAARAILKHPEFYKVAVSSAGNHDHRMAKVWWPEFYMGYPARKHYEEQSNLKIAKNLRGKLLLITGDMDNNVNPACTMRLVDELIKANKDFDMLIIPNTNHGVSRNNYLIRKRWDYFVRHLLNVEPPGEYKIKNTNK